MGSGDRSSRAARILIGVSGAGHFGIGSLTPSSAGRAALRRARSDPALMPEGLGVVEFCCGIVDAVAEHAVAVKPQAAFFEALGADGWAALIEVCGYAREAGLLVVADAKRGDVPSTARAYAAAFAPIADAMTVNPYLGLDSARAVPRARGARRIRRSSRPRTRAASTSRISRSPTGGLCGSTSPARRPLGSRPRRARAGSPRSAQSSERPSRRRSPRPGSCCRGPCSCCPASALRAGVPTTSAQRSRSGPAGALVSASRSVLYADRGADWQEAAAAEAGRLAGELRAVLVAG